MQNLDNHLFPELKICFFEYCGFWDCGFFSTADFEYFGFWELQFLSTAVFEYCGFWDCAFLVLRILSTAVLSTAVLSTADPEYERNITTRSEVNILWRKSFYFVLYYTFYDLISFDLIWSNQKDMLTNYVYTLNIKNYSK